MPLNGNIFNSSWGAESVTHYDRRLHLHDAINPRTLYPLAMTIIGRLECSLFQLDTSFDLHISILYGVSPLPVMKTSRLGCSLMLKVVAVLDIAYFIAPTYRDP